METTPLPYHAVVFSADADRAAVHEIIERAGGRVTYRVGSDIVIIHLDRPEAEVARLLSPQARLLRHPNEIPRDLPASEAIQLYAFFLRQSPAFREAKVRRPHEGREWGTGDLLAPDTPENEPGDRTVESFGPRAAAELPTNERLINDTAVGVVIVNGYKQYAISATEKTHIVAEVQEGLSWLSRQEPNANISWVLDIHEVTVDITPWEGAPWPGMPESFYKGIDAALMPWDDGKIYLFKNAQYVRFSNVAASVDAGYPQPIVDTWLGLPASFAAGLDAALWLPNGTFYFFKGSQYVRFSNIAAGMDAGYPKPITGHWPGLPAEFNDGIDAAVLLKDDRIYFFKGNQYVRFSDVSAGVDAGYPQKIKDNWPGLPAWFNEGIDAALLDHSNDKLYFFKTGKMYGTHVRLSKGVAGVDPGYEGGKPIGLSTMEAELLWRDPAMSKLGFPAGDAGLTQYIANLQVAKGTQWAYCGFYTKYPTTWFAYASGARTVLSQSSFSPNFIDIDRLVAHETGHIFGAPDEYASSHCVCGKAAGKFFSEPNNNCANCMPDLGTACIMRNNASALCAHTPWHVGWGAFMTKIDAAVWRGDDNKIYLFSNGKFIRITDVSVGRDPRYPADIAGNWHGLPAHFQQVIDAALWQEPHGILYLFKGSEYVRFTNVSNGVDAGYPKPIAGNWPGLPTNFVQGIDAALWRESDGKIYFFKGNEYVRFTSIATGVDPGYPKPIAGNWPGLPASFHRGIDAALMRKENHKIYFFKGKQYIQYDDVANTMDPGYPTYINNTWLPFPM